MVKSRCYLTHFCVLCDDCYSFSHSSYNFAKLSKTKKLSENLDKVVVKYGNTPQVLRDLINAKSISKTVPSLYITNKNTLTNTIRKTANTSRAGMCNSMEIFFLDTIF